MTTPDNQGPPVEPPYDATDPALRAAIQENASAPILQEILAGAEAFLTGAPVHVAETIPTEQVNFTAKNPFGVVYDFTFAEKNGKVVLKGTPQT